MPVSAEQVRREDQALLGCAPDEILSQLPARLSHRVLAWADRTPDATALAGLQEGEQCRLSYGQLARYITELKQLLQQQGVRPGDRVMLVAENGISLTSLFLALSELDAVAAVINARLSDREIDLIAEDCDPRLLIFTHSDSPAAAQHAARWQASSCTTEYGEYRVTRPRDVTPETVEAAAADQVLAMIYTTGTTGSPKGVMLTHQNLSFIALISGRLRGIGPGDPVYCVLPMSHVFGLSALCSSVLFSGGCVHLVARFSAAETLRAIAEDGIVGFLGVPTMYALMLEALVKQPDWQPGALRFMYSGGAPLDADLKARVEARFGMPMHNGYGLTETGPTICQTRLYAPDPACSVGFVLPGVAVKLMGENGEPVATAEVGELWAKGPNIMKGYFRKPELTAQVIRDGWFNTGDLAFQDAAGAINIAGRTKELIIRSGFNVYPPEIEAVLASHPHVSLVAVMGQQVGGDEEIVAFVQPVEGVALNVEGLLEFARQRLTGYKVPSRIEVRAELPTAPSGKILKHQLRLPGE